MMIFAVAEEGREGEPMVDKELIEIWRNMLKPSISSRLLKTNYEGKGEQDKEEFERDFDEILDLALIGLKYKAQLLQERTEKRTETRACVLIRQQDAVELAMKYCPDDDGAVQCDGDIRGLLDELENLPPAQPEHDAEFWRKRAEEYSNICLAMTAEMTKGIKFNSIRIDENGICFGKEQPEQKWIPCSETVDIPDHEIMACDRYGEFIIGYLDYKDEQWICESDSSLMYDPVAWCELPKAYKEVTE